MVLKVVLKFVNCKNGFALFVLDSSNEHYMKLCDVIQQIELSKMKVGGLYYSKDGKSIFLRLKDGFGDYSNLQSKSFYSCDLYTKINGEYNNIRIVKDSLSLLPDEETEFSKSLL